MAATALDMTSPRPGAGSPVYGVYGEPDPSALTLSDLLAAGTTLRQIPLDVLTALETGSAALRRDALAEVGEHDGRRLVGAVGFDDWWTTALCALNPGFPLEAARRLVTNKAALYTALTDHGAATPAFITGPLSTDLLTRALDEFGPRPILKPVTGAGSRGVYRYRHDLTVADNRILYRHLLTLGHIDTAIDTIAAQYVGGEPALEISVDAIVCAGVATHAVVHEKQTATTIHPFIDQVMVTPPVRPAIIDALPDLPPTIAGIVATLHLRDAALHIELRLHDARWHVLDVGVRPGAGLVAHAVHAVTGIDPRMAHLAASINRPLTPAAVDTAHAIHPAACVACGYIADHHRGEVTLSHQSDVVTTLRTTPEVFGWHLNASEVHDQIYRPDAGLSIAIGAPTAVEAVQRLRSLIETYGYLTN